MSDQVVYRTESGFNTVYVLDALPSGDLKTAQELYDSTLLPLSQKHSGFFAEYHQVDSAERLVALLAMIANDCRRYNRGPILHIEAHGTETDIALPDGSLISWRDLVNHLASINEACRMNLWVIASMCYGWHLTTSLMPSDRSPVFGVVGPPETIRAWNLQEAMKRLYWALVEERLDWNGAFAAMNENIDYSDWPIRPATAEILFCRVFRMYQDEYTTGSTATDRENDLVADIVLANGLSLLGSSAVRAHIRRDLSDHEAWYNLLRHRFLMLDLFPDNTGRFGLTYAKCLPLSSPSSA